MGVLKGSLDHQGRDWEGRVCVKRELGSKGVHEDSRGLLLLRSSVIHVGHTPIPQPLCKSSRANEGEAPRVLHVR